MKPLHKHITGVKDDKDSGNQLFPVFIKLNHLHTVLVGAGKVGLEKLTAVLANSPYARITVIAQEVDAEVEDMAAGHNISIYKKPFEDSDLDHADIVIAATNSAPLNQYLYQAAHERKLLVNIADKPELCDFYLGSIVQKGDLKIAISTNGKSPTVAKRVKEFLNAEIPDEIDITLQQINGLRETLKGDFAYKVKKLNEVTSVLGTDSQMDRWVIVQWLGLWVIAAILALVAVASWQVDVNFTQAFQNTLPEFYLFRAAAAVVILSAGTVLGAVLSKKYSTLKLLKISTFIVLTLALAIVAISFKNITKFLFSV